MNFSSSIVQKFQQAQDASQMIITDGLFSQQDRFGNQHYQLYTFALGAKYKTINGQRLLVWSIEKEKTSKISKSKMTAQDYFKTKKDMEDVVALASDIKVLLLKDNDCGIIKENQVLNSSAYQEIKHLSFDAYKKIINFSEKINNPQSIEYQTFKNLSKMTDSDIQNIQQNTTTIVNHLKALCAGNGTEKSYLKLDLGFDYLLTGKQYLQECKHL